jgi:hypothetical protein
MTDARYSALACQSSTYAGEEDAVQCRMRQQRSVPPRLSRDAAELFMSGAELAQRGGHGVDTIQRHARRRRRRVHRQPAQGEPAQEHQQVRQRLTKYSVAAVHEGCRVRVYAFLTGALEAHDST